MFLFILWCVCVCVRQNVRVLTAIYVEFEVFLCSELCHSFTERREVLA